MKFGGWLLLCVCVCERERERKLTNCPGNQERLFRGGAVWAEFGTESKVC